MTLHLTATVTGSADTSVDWTVVESSGCGAVTPQGGYTAPAGVSQPRFAGSGPPAGPTAKGATAPQPTGCSDRQIPLEVDVAMLLPLPHSSLRGRRSGKVDVSLGGPDTTPLAARPGEATLSLELAPGSYAVELQPGYQVYQDQAVVLTAIDAELLSDATQAFDVGAAATTRVEYRFVIAAGTLVFGGDEPE